MFLVIALLYGALCGGVSYLLSHGITIGDSLFMLSISLLLLYFIWGYIRE